MAINTKKIDKLKARVLELSKRIKEDMQLKAHLEKEIDALQSAELLNVVKTNNIPMDSQFLLALELAQKIQSSGMSLDEISQLMQFTTENTNMEDKKNEK